MRFLPMLGMVLVSLFATIAEVRAGVVPGLLEKGIPTGSPPRPSRFIEGDRGDAIPYLVDLETLPERMSREQALSAIENAFDAWSEATGLRFERNSTAGFGRPASDFSDTDGRIRIQCHDVFNAISGSEVLGIGGSGSINGGFPAGGAGGMVFGEEFHRTVRGYVIVNHRHPSVESPSTFEEVICHEIGHVLGLEHSSVEFPESDERLREAVMYGRVHADGRGASLSEYDRTTALKAYPLENRPPGARPAAMTAISVPQGAEPAPESLNSIRLATIDLDTPAETLEIVLHEQTTSSFGTFALDGHTLSYSPGVGMDEPQLDPADEEFYDRAIFRVHDGAHRSSYESVRVIELARDTSPTLSPDGLPDRWMIEHFADITPIAGTSDPSADPDGDGCNNLDEFMQQTDPRDPASNTSLAFDTSSPATTGEGGVLIVALTANRPLARTIELSVRMDGSAQGGGIDYLPLGWTGTGTSFLWPAGKQTHSLMIQIVDDGRMEIDETIELQLVDANGVKLAEPSIHTVTITGDAEAPIYDFVSNSYEVTETNGVPSSVEITATRSGNTSIASSVAVLRTPASGTTTTAPDPILLEFDPGETSASVDLVIEDDLIDEPLELIMLSFADFAPFGMTGIGQPDAQLLIYDDDAPPQASIIDASINEAGGEIIFPVALSQISAFPVTLHYSTIPGTATSVVDFSESAGQLLIPAGEREAVIAVPLVNDQLDESDETFELVLSDAENASIIDGRATGTILDNDPVPQLTVFNAAGDENSSALRFLVLLSAPSGREIEFQYASRDQTATVDEDYMGVGGVVRLAPGVTSHIIEVLPLQDWDVEDTETFILDISATMNATLASNEATGRILDAVPIPSLSVADSRAVESDGTISFQVSLSIPLDSALIVPYRLLGGTAVIGEDILAPPIQELTFPPGITQVSASIAILDDSFDEDDERFGLELLIDADAEIRAMGTGQGTITDDDAPSWIGLHAAEGVESVGGLPVVIRISPPSGREIRIHYQTGGGSATPGEDYEPLDGDLIIPPLAEEIIVNVPITDDSRVEETESLSFELGAWEGADHDGAAVQLRVLDDDAPQPPKLIFRDLDGVSHLSLQWQGVEGSQYEVQSSLDLRSWLPLEPPRSVRSTGLVDSVDGLPVAGRRGFYRILKVVEGE